MTAIRPNSANPKAVYLMRVPGDGLGRENAYQYWDGKGTGPSSWTGNPTAARPIFDDPHGAQGPVVTYDRGLHLYLMTVGHGTGSGGLGVFAAPTPMGPWKTVEYDNRWLNIGNGEYLGLRFPGKWISPDGRVLEGVFSRTAARVADATTTDSTSCRRSWCPRRGAARRCWRTASRKLGHGPAWTRPRWASTSTSWRAGTAWA